MCRTCFNPAPHGQVRGEHADTHLLIGFFWIAAPVALLFFIASVVVMSLIGPVGP